MIGNVCVDVSGHEFKSFSTLHEAIEYIEKNYGSYKIYIDRRKREKYNDVYYVMTYLPPDGRDVGWEYISISWSIFPNEN